MSTQSRIIQKSVSTSTNGRNIIHAHQTSKRPRSHSLTLSLTTVLNPFATAATSDVITLVEHKTINFSASDNRSGTSDKDIAGSRAPEMTSTTIKPCSATTSAPWQWVG
ncbi:hypothetical protein C1H76_4695 [Elsinoe australis]|uniref:Uncharacterized protein n=1 Tax=Elsinoe australis TaxID=40998 RepID=A0A4U7B6N4_9PEZI|nr:hypothetical protein C1H76_4695 [Elsinoe australis]